MSAGFCRTMRVLFVAFAVALVLLIGGVATYLVHIRSMATELIASAREIRTTEDAEREIAAWKVRAGNDFWTESDHPGGDHKSTPTDTWMWLSNDVTGEVGIVRRQEFLKSRFSQ